MYPTFVQRTICFFVLYVGGAVAFADDSGEDNSPDSESMRFFESKVRPLLSEHCWSCHGPEKQKGNLRLDSLAAIRIGGESGPSIQGTEIEESLLIQAVRYDGYEMPPSGKLAEKEIAILEQWVKLGAPWPASDETQTRLPKIREITAEDRNWWAFLPIRKPEVPDIKESDGIWIANDVDRFIGEQLRRHNLTMAPPADRSTLIRRLYLDLVGIPPTPAEVERYLNDESPNAYERLADSLLDNRAYGERWARHWLDLVRYADSDGYRVDHFRPNAWHYRDYVIRSLNEDKPYDRFIQEQIAGDELFPDSPEALIATGYLTHGIYEYNNRDVMGQRDAMLTDITDTTADVFLGLGMQCARCHDHKFDPILQKDYFALRAYFEPISLRNSEIAASPEQKMEYAHAVKKWEEATSEIRAKISELEEPCRTKRREQAIKIFPQNIQDIMRKPQAERAPYEEVLTELASRQIDYSRLESVMSAGDKERYAALQRELQAFENMLPKPLPVVQAAKDVGKDSPPTIIPKKRITVEPGILTVLKSDQQPPTRAHTTGAFQSASSLLPVANAEDGSHKQLTTHRRSELARWLTDPNNPLPARVLVNRLWQQHFGRGLAANSNDFGKLSEEPSHPELLDWLAACFRENGGRWKPIHRLLVTSATYRQSSSNPDFERFAISDPTNRWYWRHQTRRLDAEQIRDSILSVCGVLSNESGGPSVAPDQPRRSIYTRMMRNDRDPLLDVFDLPFNFASVASRDTTTSPIQSLHLFNSQTMIQHAKQLAEHAKNGSSIALEHELENAISNAWQLTLGRHPNKMEFEQVVAFLGKQSSAYSNNRANQDSGELQVAKMAHRPGQAINFVNGGALPLQSKIQLDAPQATSQVASEETRLTSSLANGFTVEALIQLRSIYESGNVRTIVSQRDSTVSNSGWSLGVTGKKSRHKPQYLVFQQFGLSDSGEAISTPIFSDLHLELNKSYYVGMIIQPRVHQTDRLSKAEAGAAHASTTTEAGTVTLFARDLSDDDAPLMRFDSTLPEIQLAPGETTVRIGSEGGSASHVFDGLIDEVRLTRGAVDESKLLFQSQKSQAETLAYWQFETETGLLSDSSEQRNSLQSSHSPSNRITPLQRAFVDYCHLLLNMNEFLYLH